MMLLASNDAEQSAQLAQEGWQLWQQRQPAAAIRKLDGAVRIWNQMVERFPGPHACTFGLAETYLERGEFAQALPLWEQIAASQPDDPVIQAQLQRARAGARH